MEVDESDNKEKDKKIKELQEEVEVLRKKIEQDDEYDNTRKNKLYQEYLDALENTNHLKIQSFLADCYM